MHTALEFLLRHGYTLLLGWVFVEQLGLPVPSVPLLLAAGALAGTGHLNLFASLGVAMFAALSADSLWYVLGRKKGIAVLQSLCRVSLEPDSCVRRTEGAFAKRGARSLLVAKFLPGLSTVAPPLAGIIQMRPSRFVLFDTAGALLWAGTFLGLGFAFSTEIERVAERALRLGGWLLVIVVAALASYIIYKFIARQRFLRQLRIARITPDELKKRIDAGEDLVIVDLRHSMDFEADPETIPGAFRVDAEDLQEKSSLLPLDREIVLYCT